MLKSCKRLKYVKFIVLIVKKNQPYTSEVHCIIYKKKPNKKPKQTHKGPASNHCNVFNDTGTYLNNC